MDQLPDDVLVLVMTYLSVDDILACRLVCKRLTAAATYPEVWRHRRLDGDTKNPEIWRHLGLAGKPCVCPPLRLAPCLQAVVCNRSHTAAVAATQCAVAELILDVGRGILPAEYAKAVRNQEALGRLRHVVVRYARGVKVACDDALLATLMQSSCLESLKFPRSVPLPSRLVPFPDSSSSSFLKIFQCGLDDCSEDFVNAVLASHVTSLEEVDIAGRLNDVFETDTPNLLASMPKLRKLKCEMMPGLETVAASKSLRHMTIAGMLLNYDDPQEKIESGLAFVRQANQLQFLSMDFSGPCDDFFPDWEDLIVALVSGSQCLEHLSVTNFPVPEVQRLISALPGLPSLERLTLSTVSSHEEDLSGLMSANLLVSITPAVAPALRRLELIELNELKYLCTHDWLHNDSVTLLTANPSLHIHILKPLACRCIDCETCSPRCHRQAEWQDSGRPLVLFSHEFDKCPSPEDHRIESKSTHPLDWIGVRIWCNFP